MRLNGIEVGPGGLIRFELTGVTDEEAKPLGELWGEEVTVAKAGADATTETKVRELEAALEVLQREGAAREAEFSTARATLEEALEALGRPLMVNDGETLADAITELRRGPELVHEQGMEDAEEVCAFCRRALSEPHTFADCRKAMSDMDGMVEDYQRKDEREKCAAELEARATGPGFQSNGTARIRIALRDAAAALRAGGS